MNTKKCSKCGKVKPLDEFRKEKRNRDGLSGICIICHRVYDAKKRAKYTEEDKAKISEYNKQYYKKNKHTINKQNKQYKIDNSDAMKAADKKYRFENADRIAKYQKEYKLKNKEIIKQNAKAYQKSTAKYSSFNGRLTVDEASRLSKDGVSLEVKCRYCGKYFKPTVLQTRNRVVAIDSDDIIGIGDNYLYCSKHCKAACPVYGQHNYPKTYKKATSREVQPQLRQMVLERDSWTCQKCGKTTEVAELHCHHILPLNESPMESADMDNCVTLCKKCHKETHKLPNCGYHELKYSN